jgi:two-component system, cell cycle response regulator
MKVLVAEDDAVACVIMEKQLTRCGYDVVVAHDGEEALHLLSAESAPHLAVLDRVMPKIDGAEVCRLVRASAREPYTYIVLVTGLSSEDDLLSGMDAGADDYITKPFRTAELEARLRVGRRLIEQQDNLIAAREALRAEAKHDALTGLWNHEEIIRLLELELVRAQRQGRHVGVIMVDLDHFKAINDTYGHSIGDAVLVETTQKMTSLLRPYDFLGRYGGEEFLIVLPDVNWESVVHIAERLRSGIAAESVALGKTLSPITVSMGITISFGDAPSTTQVLIDAADRALYRAKRTGRNRIELDIRDNAA